MTCITCLRSRLPRCRSSSRCLLLLIGLYIACTIYRLLFHNFNWHSSTTSKLQRVLERRKKYRREISGLRYLYTNKNESVASWVDPSAVLTTNEAENRRLSYFIDRISTRKGTFIALLETMSSILESTNSWHTLYTSTTLSYCRHFGELMPFNERMDILVFDRDLPKLFQAIDTWNEEIKSKNTALGLLKFSQEEKGVSKIFWENTPSVGIPRLPWNYPYLEIFTFSLHFEDTSDPGPARTTVTGKSCKQPFINDGVTYFDCVTDPLAKGKEWCHAAVEEGEGAPPIIEYCQPAARFPSTISLADEVPSSPPETGKWAGAQVIVNHNNFHLPYEMMFPAKAVKLEGFPFRAPRERALFLDWVLTSRWRVACKLSHYDYQTGAMKKRADGTTGLPYGVANTVHCAELALKRPAWAFSLGQILENRCPTNIEPILTHEEAYHAITQTAQTKNCYHSKTNVLESSRSLLKSFHTFANFSHIDYWLTYNTSLGQDIWKSPLPYLSLQLDVSIPYKHVEMLVRYRKMAKTKYGANIWIQPVWKIARSKESRGFRGVDFRSPIARYTCPPEKNDGFAPSITIWAEPSHDDIPDVIPKGMIGFQSDAQENYLYRPLGWVYPLRSCLFDGVNVMCQYQQALRLRYEYGLSFRRPEKTCSVDGRWVKPTRRQSNDGIPRTLHFISVSVGLRSNYGGGNLGRQLQENINGWKEINAGYNVFVWNNQMVRQHFPIFVFDLENIEDTKQLEDILRYAVLSKFGGIYVDHNIMAVRPIETVRNLFHQFSVCAHPKSYPSKNASNAYSSLQTFRCVLSTTSILGAPPRSAVVNEVLEHLLHQFRSGLTSKPTVSSREATWTQFSHRYNVPLLHSEVFPSCYGNVLHSCKLEKYSTFDNVYAVRKVRKMYPKSCTRILNIPAEVKIVAFLSPDLSERKELDSKETFLKLPSGQRCALLRLNECSADGRNDAKLWDSTNNGITSWTPDQLQHHGQVWFAYSSEAHNDLWQRRIGDAKWMAPMNYAAHFGANTDFTWGLDYNLSWTSEVPSPKMMAAKTGGILYLSSNCNVASQRDDLVRRAMLSMKIDSLGKCLHNRDWPAKLKLLEFDRSGTSLRETWGNYRVAEKALLEMYRFRWLAISTICKDYIAEKIQNTLLAGTIPIYIGMPNSHDWDPGIAAGVHPAMIHIQDFDSMSSLVAFVQAINVDTDDARSRRGRYFEYTRVPSNSYSYPRHRQHQYNKTNPKHLSWEQYICQKTHDASGKKKLPVAAPQSRCEGSWWKYFKSLGKDLRRWGCPTKDSCEMSTYPIFPKNTEQTIRQVKENTNECDGVSSAEECFKQTRRNARRGETRPCVTRCGSSGQKRDGLDWCFTSLGESQSWTHCTRDTGHEIYPDMGLVAHAKAVGFDPDQILSAMEKHGFYHHDKIDKAKGATGAQGVSGQHGAADRTRLLLNNSGHCLENCTGSRLEFEDATNSANSTASNPSYRTQPISTNYSHCMENCTETKQRT
jgi:hypothetical protein